MNNIIKLELVNYISFQSLVVIETSCLFLIVENNYYDPYFNSIINVNMLYDFRLGSSSYL